MGMKRAAIGALLFVGSLDLVLGQEAAGGDVARHATGAATASPRTFGTSQDSLQRTGAAAFSPVDSSVGYSYTNGSTTYLRYSTDAGPASFLAHPVLPSGALLVGVEYSVCDTDPVENIFLVVFSTDALGSNLQILAPFVLTAGTPGCAPVFIDLTSANFTVDNATNQVFLNIVLNSGTTTHSFAGATVFYRLQVSPAPAVASFNDVPVSHPFFQFIEALKSSGITGGCQVAPPLYCPDNFVTRGQMAVFLAKALGLQFP
jgi:hypothetical protein